MLTLSEFDKCTKLRKQSMRNTNASYQRPTRLDRYKARTHDQEEDTVELIEGETYEGEVQAWMRNQGYGFIRCKGVSETIFCHSSELKLPYEIRYLIKQQRVKFVFHNENGKYQAQKVEPLELAPTQRMPQLKTVMR